MYFVLFIVRDKMKRVCAFMFAQDDAVRCLWQWIVKGMNGRMGEGNGSRHTRSIISQKRECYCQL